MYTGEIVISDLTRCRPIEAMTPANAPREGRWRVVDYETEDGVVGKMLFAAPEDRAPTLRLTLPAEGVCRIFLGVNYTRSPLADRSHLREFSMYGNLEVMLDTDGGYSRVAFEGPWRQDTSDKVGRESLCWHAIHEAYWKTADVTGRSLIFSPPRAPYDTENWRSIANLSYVKLVPVSKTEQADWEKLTDNRATRTGALQYCTGEFTGHTQGCPMYHPIDKQRLRDAIAACLDNDIGMICFEAIRGNLCLFRTELGDVGTADNSWPAEWIDPLEAVVEAAHDNGMELLVGMRMIGASLPVVRHPIQWARYYWRHRDWAKQAPDGTVGSNLSIAFPEVREYWVRLLREAVDGRGADGVHLLFDRCFPFVLYEEPSRAAFMEKHVEDPRELPEDDSRWVQHQCDMATQFLREIREFVDEKSGRKLAIHVCSAAYGSWEAIHPKQTGCDVESWLREGLVDYLMPSPCADCGDGDGPEVFFQQWKAIDPRVKIYPDLFPRTQMATYYPRLAAKLYAAGADGYILRDGERRIPRTSEWAVQRHLGHRDMLGQLEREAPGYFRTVGIKRLNGMMVKYSYNDG